MESIETNEDLGPRLRMTPAVSKICCCSVTAAAGFVAAYTLVEYAIALIYEIVWVVEAQGGLPVPSTLLMLCYCIVISAPVTLNKALFFFLLKVAYAIALIYEIVWVVEAQGGLPVPSALLMLCYCIVISATVTLVHGLIAKENKYLLAWLISVILVLIPECALVFYMSISHWGLQGVYGGAELACYVARLPGVVCGVVLVQSAYALREARQRQLKKGGPAGGIAVTGSEFDASHYVPDPAQAHHAFTNDAFLEDSGKPPGSVADLRRHLSVQHLNYGYPPMMMPQPPPAYWQHLAERHYAASLRGFPKAYPGPQSYGTWVGPRSGPYENYKRRHSVVGAFHTDEYDGKEYGNYDERADSKSEMGYPYRHSYYERSVDRRLPPYGPEYDPRYFPGEKRLDERYEQYPDMKRPQDSSYGVNLLRHDPYSFGAQRDRAYYGAGMRNSHTSMGNESDDLTKYKDVAL